MALDDGLEKLRQAAEWLKTEPPTSERFLAALDHVAFTCWTAGSWRVRDEAARILRDMGYEFQKG